MSNYIKSFKLSLNSQVGSGYFACSIDIAEIPIGSKIILSPQLSYAETFYITESSNDSGTTYFYLAGTTLYSHAINSEVWLIEYPKEYYKPISNNCPIVFEKNSNSFRESILIPSNKDFTFNFSSQEVFDNFNIFDYGKHTVTKSFPTITIKPSLLGPRSFTFKSYDEIGFIYLHDECESDTCSGLQIESFTSNDYIQYFHDVKKYLTNCGDSVFTQTILDVQALNCNCENQITYVVTYCCDESKDIDITPCCVQWTYNCEENAEISFPIISCLPKNSEFDDWVYLEDSNSFSYNRFSNFCFDHCDPLEVEDFLLVTPDLPNSEKLSLCQNNSTEAPPTYNDDDASDASESNNLPFGNISLTKSIHQCFDKPYFFQGNCMAGKTEVTKKINDSDLDHRSFYYLTENGFFHEDYSDLFSSSGSDLIGLNRPIMNKLTTEDIDSLELPLKPGSFWQELNQKIEQIAKTDTYDPNLHDSFISVVDNTKQPVSKSIPDDNLISDQSLIYQFYHYIPKNGFVPKSKELINFTFCQLNWEYWLKDLPTMVYGSDQWYVDLNQEFFPEISVLNNSNDLSIANINFESSNYHVYNNISNGIYNSDNISLLKINNVPKSSPRVEVTQDYVYDTQIQILSEFFDFEVTFKFNPDPSKISNDYNSINFPIERREKGSYFVWPTNAVHGSRFNSKKENYAKDSTLGIQNPKFYLSQGFGLQAFPTFD